LCEDLDQKGIKTGKILGDRIGKQNIVIIMNPPAPCQPHGKRAVELDSTKLGMEERWKTGKEICVKVGWNSRKVENANVTGI
jgi:hypothetical protein